MMKKKLLKNKKGFSLVECVVALLLFSIITGLVITVFSSSRNQIRKQNENHKLDMLASNMLSAYEASESFDDFSRIVNSNLGIDIGSSAPRVDTVPLGSGSGAGSIPVAASFNKILVNNGEADFLDDTVNPVITFKGGYANNKLTEGDNGDIPSDQYNKKNYVQMIICGGIKTAGGVALSPHNYKCTITKNEMTGERSIKFQIDQNRNDFEEGIYDNVDNNSKWNTCSINYLSDFDEFLLDNAYYLKLVSQSERKVQTGSHKVGLITIKDYAYYDDCYFQVYNAAKAGTNTGSCTPVKNGSGQNLYYCMTFTQDDWEGLEKSGGGCVTAIDDATKKGASSNPEKMMIPLTKATVKYIYSNSCPDYSGFQTELKNSNGSKFTGNWHFLSWVLYRSATGASSGKRLESANDTMFCRNHQNYNEYTPKTEAYKSVYYAMQKDNDVKLVNKDGDVIFSFNATNKENPLSTGSSVFKDTKITKVHQSADWQLYYQQGSMPQKEISKIVFNNNTAAVYDTYGNVFIRFIYKNGKFNEDFTAVKSGDYKDYFTVSGDTATVKDEWKGDIYFSCEKFDGSYAITTQALDNDPIFVSNANDFEIIGAVINSDLSYGVIGQSYAGNVESETYYITCGLDKVDRKLIIKVTFTNLAKVKQSDGDTYIEPCISIWSIDGDKLEDSSLEGLQGLSTTNKVKLEYSYRKG